MAVPVTMEDVEKIGIDEFSRGALFER